MDANVLAYYGDRLQPLNQRTTFIGSVPVSHCDGSLLHQGTPPSSAAHYSTCRRMINGQTHGYLLTPVP
jgi:hypothetical protein